MAERGAVAALAVAVVLAGCTSHSRSGPQQFFDRAVVSESEVRLGDAVMAFFVGPQNSEMYTAIGEVHEPGYLILVYADGSFRAVKTKRMDMMAPAWSGHGLYFADESHDYHLTTSGLTKTENPKVNAQNLMFALSTGGSVGVYNGGHGASGGYSNQVSAAVGEDPQVYDAQGNYFTGAHCDGQIFGITNRPGNHQGAAPKLSGLTSAAAPDASPQMLARLYPADGGEKVVAWRPHFGGGTPAGQVPCLDGVITFLSWDTDASGRQEPKIISWNTATGDHQAHPLTFDDATELSFEDFGYAVQDSQGGQLHWVYADGRVFSTDIATGKTVTNFDTALQTGARRPTQTLFAFSDAELHALSTTRGAEGDITYTVFNRADGRVLSKVSVPIPNTGINVTYLNLSRMVVRPGA
ncbi:hypothetical protein [Polymorphospora rubra]|uniref:Lipoprotein n=1 Tax=Polymorphospora rubra TaxID=338584 RepID=A0A810N670_9ACTN|nr:hypothetical protein [Polymorphospora rubra]BCJ68470.1 hypothetical protein Prubr_54910 [Polymorphospora rubra]